jgi:hypothetical protein
VLVGGAKLDCLEPGGLEGLDDRLEVHILQNVVGDRAELHGIILSELYE